MSSLPPLKPKALQPSDTIGIVAPAGCGERELALAGIDYLKQQGYQVVPGKSLSQKWGYLAGTEQERLEDIHAMFAAPEIDAIFCLRGGYGTMRLLPLLDYNLIKTHPKIFVGYSDITALHIAINQYTGLITFHGPMVASDMKQPLPDYTWQALKAALTQPAPLDLLSNPSDTVAPSFLVAGKGAGVLTGGNLSLICATLGTPYEIDTCGKILYLEEVGEAPYRIDRLLTQLLLAGKLQSAVGIVLGSFSQCEAESEDGFTLQEVLKDRLSGLSLPVMTGLCFGHLQHTLTLPQGSTAVLDSSRGLILNEAAVLQA